MPFFRSRDPADDSDSSSRPTWISAELRISGEIAGEGNVFIEGSLRGAIESKGEVVVQSSGRVEADVAARRIEVHGTVVGDLVASEEVVLGAGARVIGDITTPSLAVSPGATFHGVTRSGRSDEPGPAVSGEAK